MLKNVILVETVEGHIQKLRGERGHSWSLQPNSSRYTKNSLQMFFLGPEMISETVD
jgi:hypothetical protein